MPREEVRAPRHPTFGGRIEEETTRSGAVDDRLTTGTPLAVNQGHTFFPGELVMSRFRIVRLIGAGGMGEVYAARDLLLGEEMALKTVRLGTDVRSVAAESLRREVVTARRVSHPGVCRVFELFHRAPAADREPGILFLTMELLAGETLYDRLKREGPPQESTARRIASQVAEALEALHRAGVVHGDLKPSNVFLVPTPAGDRAVLTDFGLAETLARPMGRRAVVLGTPAFMAPEVLEGAGPSEEADVFALGALIHALASGRPPADGRLAEEVPASWREVIGACLRPAPEDRPESAVALFGRVSESANGGVEPVRQKVAVVAWSASRHLQTGGAAAPVERRFRRHFAQSLGATPGLRLALVDLDEIPPDHQGADVESVVGAAASRLLALTLSVVTEQRGKDLAVHVELVEGGDPTGTVVFRDRGSLAEPAVLAQRLAGRIGRWLQSVPPLAKAQRPQPDRPGDGEPAYRAALKQLKRHQPAGARRLLLKALRSGAVDARTYSALARATQLLGDAPGAELYAQRAIDLATGASREDILSLEALRFEIAGEWRTAARIYQALWTIEPRDREQGSRLALSLARAGKGREALSVVAELRMEWDQGGELPSLDLIEAEAAVGAGDLRRGLTAARRASLRARRKGLDGVVAEARLVQGTILRRLGRYRVAGRALTSAAHRFEREDRIAEAADALRRLVEVQRYLPAVRPDRAIARKAMQLSSEVGDRAGLAASLSQLGVLRMVEGDFEGAEDRFREALSHSRAIGDLAGVAQSVGNMGLVDAEFGRLRRASDRHHEALHLYQELGNHWAAAKERASLGCVDLALGRAVHALRQIESAAADLEALGADTDAATAGCIAVEAQLERGVTSAGRRTLARALRLGRRTGSQYLVRTACLVAGTLEMHLDRPAPARRLLERARGRAVDSTHLTAELRWIDLDLSEGLLEDAACRAEAVGVRAAQNANRSLAAMALGRMALIRLRQGRDDAVTVACRALQEVADMEDILEALRVRASCAFVLALRGRTGEGIEILKSSLHVSKNRGLVLLGLQIELWLGGVELVGERSKRGEHRLRLVAAEARSRGLSQLTRQAEGQLGLAGGSP